MLLGDVLGLALVGVGASEALNRLRLILGRSIRVAALGTEHLPKPLVLPVGDPFPLCVMTPAKTQPTSRGEMVVPARCRVIERRPGVKCPKSNAQREIATTYHEFTVELMGRADR